MIAESSARPPPTLSQGRPVAVIRVSRDGVEVTPVIDFTKVGVTLLLGVIGVWRALRR